MNESTLTQLEQAIVALTDQPTNEKLFAVLQLLRDLMDQKVTMLVPADKLPDGAEDKFQFRMLQASDGSGLLVAFTSQAELDRGESTAAVQVPLEEIVQTAMANEQVGGIVLNPWGKPFRINRQIMEVLQQMGEEESSDLQLCSADHVPDDFVAALREGAALITDIRSIAIAGLLRQGEGSFLLIVECEEGADEAKTFERLSAHLKPTVLPVDVSPADGPLPECARVLYHKL